MDDPEYCSSCFRARILKVAECIQTSSLKAIYEKQLLSQLSSVTSAAADIERSWRYQCELEKTRSEDLLKEVECLKSKLETCQSEKSDLKRRLEASRAAIELGKEERKNEELQEEARIARALHARNEEIEKWKKEYTQEMKTIVSAKVNESRLSAQSEHRSILNAALARLEGEYRSRVEERQRATLEAETRAATAIQIAEALRLRIESVQEIKHSFDIEKQLRQTAESQVLELRGRLQTAINEGNRLRNMVEVERCAYKSMIDVRKEEEGLKRQVQDHMNHSDDRLKHIPEKDERVLLALNAELTIYKKKSEILAEKVLSLEALLNDLDRQIVPVKSD